MNCNGNNQGFQAYEDVNCQGNNFCYANRNMVIGPAQPNQTDRFAKNSFPQMCNQQETYANCSPMADTMEQFCQPNIGCEYGNTTDNQGNCVGMSQPCVGSNQPYANPCSNQGWNYMRESENAGALHGCVGKQNDCDIPPNITKFNPGMVGGNYMYELNRRIGSGNERFDRWKTNYQETTDDLARDILKNNIDCRRKLIYPRRCVVCDSADDAMVSENLAKMLHPVKSNKPSDFNYCCDYQKNDCCPVQPAPPMKCINSENCFKPFPTYDTDVKRICSRTYRKY